MKRQDFTTGTAAITIAIALPLIAMCAAAAERDETEFIKISIGQNLKGWDGDPEFWRIENGTLIGETTPTHPLEHSSYILWRERKIENFELVLEFRLQGGNSGVQYRSLDGDANKERWTDVKGYQADLDAEDKWSGILYEVGMRKFLAKRGEKVVLEDGKEPRVVESVGDPAELQKKIHKNDWNEYRIIARGTHLVHLINGHVMIDATDNSTMRIRSGYIGFQLHQGPPMKIEYRNIRLKEYP